jgi:hypothetical protein
MFLLYCTNNFENFRELKQQVISAEGISELFSQPKIFGEEVASLLHDEPHL